MEAQVPQVEPADIMSVYEAQVRDLVMDRAMLMTRIRDLESQLTAQAGGADEEA